MSGEEPNIVVRKVRGEKKVGFRGMQYLDKPESEMRELVDEYGDAIIAFHDADEHFENIDRYWRFGQIIDEYTEGEVDTSELKELLKLSTLDIVQTYDMKLWHNFYKMFPQGDYNPDFPWSIYRDMVVNKRREKSKRVYSRLQENLNDGEIPRTYEYRAFLKCDAYDMKTVIRVLYKIGEHQTAKLTIDKLVEGYRRIQIMAGLNPGDVTNESVRETIGELEGLELVKEDP